MFLRNLVFGLMPLFVIDPVTASAPSPYYRTIANHPIQRSVIATATGTVNATDATERTVNISHSPIEIFGWPAMTMDFPVPESIDLSKIKPGDHVVFTIERDAADNYTVTSIRPEAEDGGPK